MQLENGDYQLDTGWGCGLVTICDNIIIHSAPIFNKLRGQSVPNCYKVKKLNDQTLQSNLVSKSKEGLAQTI